MDFGHDSEPAVISHGGAGSEDSVVSGTGPLKQKKKQRKQRKQKRKQMKGMRKRKGQHGSGVEHEQSDLSLGLGLLDDLADADDLLSSGGGKRKHRNPINYGRSNGGVCCLLRVVFHDFNAPFSEHNSVPISIV